MIHLSKPCQKNLRQVVHDLDTQRELNLLLVKENNLYESNRLKLQSEIGILTKRLSDTEKSLDIEKLISNKLECDLLNFKAKVHEQFKKVHEVHRNERKRIKSSDEDISPNDFLESIAKRLTHPRENTFDKANKAFKAKRKPGRPKKA